MMDKLKEGVMILRRDGFSKFLKSLNRFFIYRLAPVFYSIRRTLHRGINYRIEYNIGETLYPTGQKWITHTEDWIRVKNRWEHREAIQNGESLSISEAQQDLSDRVHWIDQSSFRVSVPPGKEDRWVYLYLDPADNYWQNFKWKFRVQRDSPFRELQFAIRYKDFYNRHRFRHESDKFHFDRVTDGWFYKWYGKEPFKMELGEEYEVAITVIRNRFILEVDGDVILDEFDFSNDFSYSSCAIIFWESDKDTPIEVTVEDMSVEEIIVP